MRKKLPDWLVLAVSAMIFVFSLGFFFGRNQLNRYDTVIQISHSAAEIPAVTETEAADPGADAPSEADNAGSRIDLNTAAADELMTLPGIGETLAQRILDYRSASGGFLTIEQLMEVSGIGEATFEGLKDQITVEDMP